MLSTFTRLARSCAALGILVLAGCPFDGPTEPQRSKERVIQLTSARPDVAALLIEVRGSGAVETLEVLNNLKWRVSQNGDVRTVLLMGPFTSSELLRVTLVQPDADFAYKILDAARGASGGFAQLETASIQLITK